MGKINPFSYNQLRNQLWEKLPKNFVFGMGPFTNDVFENFRGI